MANPPSYKIDAFVLADYYLKALGWPSTPTTRRVLAAWFMRESPRAGGNNIIVRGNNPLNITCTSCSNYWLAGNGKVKVVTFDSPAAGAQAFAHLINGGGPGYSGIVSAFKSNPDNGGFIVGAITRSGWVTGNTNSYIYQGKNGLAATYNGLGGSDIPTGAVLGPPNTAPVKAFGDLVSFPDGHIITETDIASMSKTLDDNHFFANYIQKVAFEEFMKQNALGKPWNKNLEDTLAKQAGVDAANVGNATNIPSVTLNVFGALAGKATAVGALLVGGVLVGIGTWLIVKDVYSQGGSGMVDPTPIFVRE